MMVPPLETERLMVRPFVPEDLDALHYILDVELADRALSMEEQVRLREERATWLQWSILSYGQFASLHQPPFGDRAIVLQGTDEVIGACGYVPLLDALGQIPGLGSPGEAPRPTLNSLEVGLYYALSPRFQGRGYATEAAKALVAYGFEQLRLRRIVANTTYENEASMAVMRRLGMRVERNPFADPPWLQVVGYLDNPGHAIDSPEAPAHS